MASSPLQAFDPFAKHPFTAHGSAAPQPFSVAAASTPRTTYAVQPSSLPTQQTPRPPQLKSPQPMQGSPSGQPIFTAFHKDRASPDLPGVRQKPAASWGKDATGAKK